MFSQPGSADETPRNAPIQNSTESEYPIIPEQTPDHELREINPNEVTQRNGKDSSATWLVIDNIVYDCTNFIGKHPGGEAVLQSFAGKDCSWQFHKIHGLQKTRKWLPYLRVGRTEGVQNPFAQPNGRLNSSFSGSEP